MSDEGIQYLGADRLPRTVGVSNPLPVDIGSASVTITGDVVGEIDGVEEALGAPADAAAASDSATSSLIGLIKRLLGKLPTLVSGRIPVDGSGVTQPVSATSLPLPTGAATSANQTTSNTSLASIDGKLPALSSGNVPVVPAVQLGSGAMTATTQRVTLATDGPTVTSLSSIDTKTPALQSGAVPIGDNSGSLTVDGKAYRVAVDITRPANTTAYTAGDVIGTGSGDAAIITLASIGPSAGFVLVQSIELVIGISAVPSGMTSFRLHFYNAKPTAIADNAAFNLVSGDRSSYIGYIDLPAPQDFGDTCFTQVDYPGKLFKLDTASTSLFVQLQTIGGFTPAANSEVYSLRVKTLEAGL
jgi:hypothetical protein